MRKGIDARAARDACGAHAAEEAFRLAPLAAALAALLILIAGGAWWFLNANRPASVAARAPAEAARLSIVVLPFANLSGDPGQDYLVDALTDELTTSRAPPRQLRHRAQYRLHLQGQAGRREGDRQDLGVRYVLEGLVQPSGDRTRVNAQLIDAESGAHLWAEQFDTPRADLLQTQDAIVTHLANTLNFQLTEAEGVVSNGRLQPSRRRGPGASMHSGLLEERICRQRGGCSNRPVRTGARHRSQQCPGPDANRVEVLHAGSAWRFRRP